MDIYTATEMAYKNGYEQGLKDTKSENVDKHFRKFCPMLKEDCIEEQCAWWLDFAKGCALPVATGILADSTISRSY